MRESAAESEISDVPARHPDARRGGGDVKKRGEFHSCGWYRGPLLVLAMALGPAADGRERWQPMRRSSRTPGCVDALAEGVGSHSMALLETIGAHLLGLVLRIYQTIALKPRPELKFHELVPTGGGTNVDFRAALQDVGTKSARCLVTARVGETPVIVQPATVDLVANAAPVTIQIRVPRPALGTLVQEFANETTLYGRELVVEAIVDGKRRRRQSASWRAVKTWNEPIYTVEENSVRHEIQQRAWRAGRGEATPDDDIADLRADAIRAHEERVERGDRP